MVETPLEHHGNVATLSSTRGTVDDRKERASCQISSTAAVFVQVGSKNFQRPRRMGKQKTGIKSINLSIPVTRIGPNLTAKKEIRRRVALTFFHQVDSKVTWGVAYRSMIFVWLLIKYYTTLCVCYSAADHERAIKETKAKRQKHVAQRQTQKRRQRHVKRGNPLCRLDLIIVVTAAALNVQYLPTG